MTEKQLSAINNSVENGGNISKAMKDAGYSPNTAKTPKKLTESKAWNELIDEHLSEVFLLTALHEDITNNPGNRKAELEMGFKITNKLNPKLSEVEIPKFFNITRGLPITKNKSTEQADEK